MHFVDNSIMTIKVGFQSNPCEKSKITIKNKLAQFFFVGTVYNEHWTDTGECFISELSY